MSESGSAEVIETPLLRLERDPESGRKMINQYLVLHEIGHGTHGRVRLGQDLAAGLTGDDDADVNSNVDGSYYAIKIVDRVPKRRRLAGLNRQKGIHGRTDGVNLMNETEIRKEIAIFKKVNHPNVVRMKEIIDDPESSKLFMILEFCEGGEVQWQEEDGSPALTLAETRRIFRDTLLGLEYLHHQGIIHRDIKPSNLLYAGDGTVKISDFGCSHYSEALRTAANHGPEGEGWVDDIELAKTAGSPAFFAPEMCYSGLEDEELGLRSPKLQTPPTQPLGNELPNFTLRPPSFAGDDPKPSRSEPIVLTSSGRTLPLRTTVSNDSAMSSRPISDRSRLSYTGPRRERLPITNAIDVWALGVTLYCLAFGKTPFDAPNEYLLMQVIPAAEFAIPARMSKDRLSTGSDGSAGSAEASECLDLISHLLEKDPNKRLSLDQAKRHPFTLRGLPDPSGWLAKTDPHVQSYVTVSSDEVAAVVINSGRFRDRVKRSFKTISSKLGIFAPNTRNRSRSIGDGDTSSGTSQTASALPSAAPSQLNLQSTVTTASYRPDSAQFMGEISPSGSPIHHGGGLTRRLSILGSRIHDAMPSPRRSNSQLASPGPSGHSFSITGTELAHRSFSSQSNQSAHKGFFVHRPDPASLTRRIASGDRTGPIAQDVATRSPRPVTSSGSLDRLRSQVDSSPETNLLRRQSDVDVPGRSRSDSVTSTHALGIGSRLVRLLSRTSSQRSRSRHPDPGEEDLTVVASDRPVYHQPVTPHSSDPNAEDGSGRRSLDTFESSSCSSSHGLSISPDLVRGMRWDTRLRNPPFRRGSSLSEEYAPGIDGEEVDWNGSISDDDLDPASARVGRPYARAPSRPSVEILPPERPHLRSFSTSHERLISQEDSTKSPLIEGALGLGSGQVAPTSRDRLDDAPRNDRVMRKQNSPSPYRPGFADRSRAPLSAVNELTTSAQLINLNQVSADPVDVPDDADGDEGLAFSIGGKRLRRGSAVDLASP